MTAPEPTAVERTIADLRRRYQDQVTQALHERWHVGCHRECGGRLDDFLAAGRMLEADGVIASIVVDVTRQQVAAIRNLPPEQQAQLIGGELLPCPQNTDCAHHQHVSRIFRREVTGSATPARDLTPGARDDHLARAWDEGYEAAWGHTDWQEDEPSNPYEVRDV